MMLLLAGILACDGDEPAPAATCSLEPRAAATPVAGDANGDGVVDIADGAAVLSHLFRAGPALACDAAADTTQDGTVDAGDGISIWYHLFAGTSALPTLATGACEKPTRAAETCGDGLTLAVDAPATATGARGSTTRFDATVTLTTADLTVDALSLGLAAAGCTIAEATFAGTAAAETRDGGLRNGGFGRIDVEDGGVIEAVAWDVAGDAALPPSDGPASVLAVTVEAVVDGSCSTCELTLGAGLIGSGEAVTTVASARGLAYVPEMRSVSVQVCPG